MNALALRLSPRMLVALLALVLVACLIVAFVVTGAAHHMAVISGWHVPTFADAPNVISGWH